MFSFASFIIMFYKTACGSFTQLINFFLLNLILLHVHFFCLVQKEIEERQNFLEEMITLGQGAKYRPIISTEISQVCTYKAQTVMSSKQFVNYIANIFY